MGGNILTVEMKRPFPQDLKEQWEREFAAHGFEVEIGHGISFAPSNWVVDWLPILVKVAPAQLTGFTLEEPIESGFDLSFDDAAGFLSNKFHAELESRICNATAVHAAVFYLGAATLAVLCNGRCTDERGRWLDRNKAVAYAIQNIKAQAKDDQDSVFETSRFTKNWHSKQDSNEQDLIARKWGQAYQATFEGNKSYPWFYGELNKAQKRGWEPPEIRVDIVDADGVTIVRPELVWRAQKVAIFFEMPTKDLLSKLEGLGWSCIAPDNNQQDLIARKWEPAFKSFEGNKFYPWIYNVINKAQNQGWEPPEIRADVVDADGVVIVTPELVWRAQKVAIFLEMPTKDLLSKLEGLGWNCSAPKQ
jgi:hypothetical protein